MKSKFEKFLKKHRLYSAFVRHLSDPNCNGYCANNNPHRCVGRKSAMSFYLESHEDKKYQWVGSGFIWSDTPEDERWIKLDAEWEEVCNGN